MTWLLSCEASSKNYLYPAVLVMMFGVFGISMVALGAAPINGPWDVMALLDGAWRIVNGQVPHRDFHNPVGPLQYLLTAFGLVVAPVSTSSICYGNVLLLVILLPWAWFISSRRLPRAVAFCFVLWLGILLISPRPLGYAIRETTYAMMYNRDGYVMLSMFMVGVFVGPRTREARWVESADDVLMGVLLVVMFYCKITYVIVGATCLLFAFVVGRRSWRAVCAVFAGAALSLISVYVVFHIDPRSYLADVSSAGRSQSLVMRLHLLAGAFMDNGYSSYVALFCMTLWGWVERQCVRPQLWGVRPWIIGLWIMACALMLDSGNAAQLGRSEDPLYFTAGVVFVELYRRRHLTHVRSERSLAGAAYAASLLLICPLFAGPILGRDLTSLAYACAWNLRERPKFDSSRYLHSTALRDFRVPASTPHITCYWAARDHPTNINDGIDLLRRNIVNGDRVTTIAYTNPFSFALGLKPAHDGPQWWDLDFSFNERTFPSAQSVLADASVVMVPRLVDRSQGWSFETVDLMLRLYGPYLQTHFQLLGVSNQWMLYRRAGF
jgi:hypothetical protein